MSKYKKVVFLVLFPLCLSGASFSTLEEEYTPHYCLQLEAAYGEGLMSEGGEKGIESLFEQIPLQGTRALDIGSGLGGVAFYLADRYTMRITGLDVNAWMIAESERRTPAHLQGRVDFLLSTNNENWPLPSNSYDIIYSKGVLTHLEEKDSVFQECHRLLNEEGLLVIADWLSSDARKWGCHIAKLVELENLVLFPESEQGYCDALERNGFSLLSQRDESALYIQYNRDIIQKLKTNPSSLFDEADLNDAIVGYESILKALEEGELRVLRFVAKKN